MSFRFKRLMYKLTILEEINEIHQNIPQLDKLPFPTGVSVAID